ncbi:MAG: hypothetical protein ACFBRM_11275 [Pikeienuella sp.]
MTESLATQACIQASRSAEAIPVAVGRIDNLTGAMAQARAMIFTVVTNGQPGASKGSIARAGTERCGLSARPGAACADYAGAQPAPKHPELNEGKGFGKGDLRGAAAIPLASLHTIA